MATAPKQAIASPQIFNTDPIESVYANALTKADPSNSGFIGSLLLAAGTERDRNQSTYLDQLQKSNALATALAQQQNQADLVKEALQQGHHYTSQGFLPGDIPLVGQLFGNPNAASVTDVPKSYMELRRAQIAKLLAEATKDRASGGPKITLDLDTSLGGAGASTYKVQGADPNMLYPILTDLAKKDAAARAPGGPLYRNTGRTEAQDLATRAVNKHKGAGP